MIATLLLAATAALAQAAEPSMPNCLVVSIDSLSVPGADSGVLTELVVKEGMKVTKGMKLGTIDVSEAQAHLQIKQYEAEVADLAANSDVDVLYAEKAADVAKAAHERLVLGNQKVKGTTTEIDIKRAELEWQKMILAIRQAKEKSESNVLTAKAKHAEAGAAKTVLDRRVLRAPFDGVVDRISKKPGEWVAAGEPVVHVTGVKRLRVQGYLDAEQWAPRDVDGRPVTAEVALPREKTVKVPGRVVYVSPVVIAGRLEVWAEVETPMENDLPVVRSGLKATLTIHTNQPLAETPQEKTPETPVRRTSAPAGRK